ncbi:hypothetical protein [Halorientalis persicus]|nr:hypothetical protein [Halorientalis persicus]
MGHHELICRSCGAESRIQDLSTTGEARPTCPNCRSHSFAI